MSERRRKRSLHFLTGTKRVRGTTTAEEPEKHSMAAPIAVSSCQTAGDLESLGSTVLPFLIMGRGISPPAAWMASLSLSRRTQRLLVLKYLWSVTSWKAASSVLAHWADSRRINCPSAVRTAKCPPFLSASVRSAHSTIKLEPDSAKYVNKDKSSVAPRLSELLTNIYFTPSANRRSSVPDPSNAAYRSP